MATFSYFYTLSATTDYEEYFDTAEQGSVTQEEWLKFDDLKEMVHEEYRPTGGTNPVNGIYTGPASEAAPYATTLKVKKLMKVTYYLRYYLKAVDSGVTKYYWLTDDAIHDIKITPTDSSKYYKYKGVDTVKPGNKGWVKTKYPNVLGNTSGHCFVFTMYVKAANFNLDAPFTVTAKVTPDGYSYGSITPNPSSTEETIGNNKIAGVNPKIKCTQAKVIPTPNSNFLNFLEDTSTASGYHTEPSGSSIQGTEKDLTNFQFVYAYDGCTKDTKKSWIGVKWGRTVSADRKKILVKYTVVYGSKDGQGFDPNSFKPKTEEATKGKTNITSPSLEKILDKVIAARISNCAPAADNGTTDDSGDKGTLLVRPVPPLGSLRWNPPPHIDARGVNFAYRLNNPKDENILRSELYGAYNDQFADKRFERGRIFQDKVTAKVMNTEVGISLKTKSAQALQWGYQFMYNPETISYQTSDGSGIDWTYGSKDKAVVMSGSQTISFDLLINRIPDMFYLSQNDVPQANVYGRSLEDYEAQGILKRGTEYDIEFLYRVLTGDPGKNSLLLEPGYAKTALTSDIGYITKVPVWLYLHDNMRFFGSISGLSVMHRIFDQNMVPTLTRMTVTFTRYPAFEGKAPETKSTATSTGN
jgi:hypothetical protein